jgi:hypothetical protein
MYLRAELTELLGEFDHIVAVHTDALPLRVVVPRCGTCAGVPNLAGIA